MSKPIPLRSDCPEPQGICGRCDIDQRSFRVEFGKLTPDGCMAVADEEWGGDCDFIRLLIDGRIHINGRVLDQNGRHARIRFFGQIHPFAIAELCRRAA